MNHVVIAAPVEVVASSLPLQFKEFLGTYNKVTENCFMDCVKDFTSRDLKPEEVKQEVVDFVNKSWGRAP